MVPTLVIIFLERPSGGFLIVLFYQLFQPPKSILASIQMHPKVPIHTISFNCSDREANEFLCELAKESGGRFHYWSENGLDLEGPEPWEVRMFCKLTLDRNYGKEEKKVNLGLCYLTYTKRGNP